MEFRCLCPRCYSGQICQFNTRGLSFTLDSLIWQSSLSVQVIYLALSSCIFFIGGFTNYASFVTFKRPNPRKFGVGNYLLIVSLLNQCSLLSYLLKVFFIFFPTLLTIISCKIVSYVLSVSTRYNYWLTSWITLERVCSVLFPFNDYLKSPRSAIVTSFITLFVVTAMHIHEIIFYMIENDPHKQTMCIGNLPVYISTYNYINVLIHHLVPFCIQILSITVLIVLIARSRSRAIKDGETFIKVLKRQFQNQKELYITPLIIVLSGLPQIIISFTFSCTELAAWTRHLLSVTYLLSFAPQLLGFMLFVLPSNNYFNEFQQTQLS